MRFYSVILGTLALVIAREWPQQAQAQESLSEGDRPAESSPEEDYSITVEAAQVTMAPPDVTTMPVEMAKGAHPILKSADLHDSEGATLNRSESTQPIFDNARYSEPDKPPEETSATVFPELEEVRSDVALNHRAFTLSTEPNIEGINDLMPPIVEDLNTQLPPLYRAQSDTLTVEEEQKLESLREQYTLPELSDTHLLDQNPSGALSSPGSAIGVPSAFGASWRNVFAGLTIQERTRFTDRSDGAMSVGFGLGDAETSVGLEVAVAIVDLLGEGAFEDGSVSLKLHRQLGNGWAIATGIENFATFGSTDGGSSGYGVVTKVTQVRARDKPFNTLTTSLGIGGGRFRPEGRLDQDDLNVFGSVAVRVAEPVSLIADWSGQDLNLGVSVVPFVNLPLVITPAAVDVTGSAGDGVRFSVGLGVGHRF